MFSSKSLSSQPSFRNCADMDSFPCSVKRVVNKRECQYNLLGSSCALLGCDRAFVHCVADICSPISGSSFKKLSTKYYRMNTGLLKATC